MKAKISVSKLLITLSLLSLGLVIFGYNQHYHIITLENFQVHSQALKAFIRQHYLLAVFSFWLLYLVVVNTAIPALTLLNLVGGYLFGTVGGSLYCTIGLISGATLQFLLSRYLFSAWVIQHYHHYYHNARQSLARHQTAYLLTLRIIPGVPFVASNLILGVTKIKLWSFIWTATLGMVGKIIIYSYAGQQLQAITELNQVITPTFIKLYLGYILLIMVPALIITYRIKRSIPSPPDQQQ